TSAYTAPAGMPCSRARKKSVPTEAANTISYLYRLLEVHGRRLRPVRVLPREADPRLVRRPTDHLEGVVLLHLHQGEAVGTVAVRGPIIRGGCHVLARPVE